MSSHISYITPTPGHIYALLDAFLCDLPPEIAHNAAVQITEFARAIQQGEMLPDTPPPHLSVVCERA